MYNKVRWHSKEEIKRLRGEIKRSDSDVVKAKLAQIVDYMDSVQMAVVISEEAGEEGKFQNLELDIKPHRQRMKATDQHGHDIEYNFKDPGHPVHLVFVCAMWLTGFDAPTVSTIYVDKPMKDHTLVQTIARANRVTTHTINGVTKKNGEIVDYYNVFRNLKIALKDYALGDDENADAPVQDKDEIAKLLEQSIEAGFSFCDGLGVPLGSVMEASDTFAKLQKFKQYADELLGNEETRKTFNV